MGESTHLANSQVQSQQSSQSLDAAAVDMAAAPADAPHNWGKKGLDVLRDDNTVKVFDFIIKLAAVIGILYGSLTFVNEARQRSLLAMQVVLQTQQLRIQADNAITQTNLMQNQAYIAKLQAHLIAFQAIADATTHGDSSDRREALEYLVKQKVDLLGITVTNAHLQGIHLDGAQLGYAHLFGTDFTLGHLRRASLVAADLRGINLQGADLRGANLDGVDLRCFRSRKETLVCANLASAILRGALGIPKNIDGAIWSNSICPDGTNSDRDLHTCAGHFLPI